jgi:CRP-like cAMP-binding protein
MEVHPAKQWAEIVKTGDHDDALDLILEGELRVRMRIAGKETILTTLGTGEFFGEIFMVPARQMSWPTKTAPC